MESLKEGFSAKIQDAHKKKEKKTLQPKNLTKNLKNKNKPRVKDNTNNQLISHKNNQPISHNNKPCFSMKRKKRMRKAENNIEVGASGGNRPVRVRLKHANRKTQRWSRRKMRQE